MVDAVSGSAAASTGATTTSSSSAAADIDFDTYLKLLVVQLENQDPLDPMDPNEMAAQIATYSQIEQQLQSNKYLAQIAGQNDLGQQTLAVSYIGKEVLVPGVTLSFEENTATEDFAYELKSDAYSTKIEIRDADNTLVKTLDGSTTAGLHYITWDGTDDAGELLATGNYKVSVSGSDTDGEIVEITPYVYIEVVAVESEGSDISLMLADNTRANFDDARTVRGIAQEQQADAAEDTSDDAADDE